MKVTVGIDGDESDIERALHHLLRNPAYSKQWHLHGRTAVASDDVSLNCELAWRALGSFGAKDIVVGIVDDGFQMSDQAYQDQSKFAGWARVETDNTIRVHDTDKLRVEDMSARHSHHGDAQCGLIAADYSSTLPIGVAPGVRLFPIRLEKENGHVSLSDSILRRIIDLAAQHCDILLNSWGRSPNLILTDNILAKIERLANCGGKHNRGVLFVWPAGNGNRPINFNSDTPIIYKGGVNLRMRRTGRIKKIPTKLAQSFRNNVVSLPNVLVVGSITSFGQRAHYSCYGEGLHICAPSNNHHALGLQEMEGLGITTCTGWGDRYTDDYKGTSASAALVAGAAALGLTARPDLSATELREAILSSASKNLNARGYPPEVYQVEETGEDISLSPPPPYNTGSFDHTGWSPWFGAGKCDAFALVTHLSKGRTEKGMKYAT